ncbi:hypothetical protein LSTR_LSTR009522 [Laodelphax striatellus]|uniref:Uncharacterized protein n=1 Tax=Laodelphax striatellus TaxID=195883 RepID=A0A482XQE8_LAOST|nr:hypothetical protein LSTR_LSTR009522 [Laodelphax striatellus]
MAEICCQVRNFGKKLPDSLTGLAKHIKECVEPQELAFCPQRASILHACEQARMLIQGTHFSHTAGTFSLKVHMVANSTQASAILCLHLLNAVSFLLKVLISELRFQPSGGNPYVNAHELYIPEFFRMPKSNTKFLEVFGVMVPSFAREFLYSTESEVFYPSFEIILDSNVRVSSAFNETIRQYLIIVWSNMARDMGLTPYCDIPSPDGCDEGSIVLYERTLFLAHGTFKVKGSNKGLMFLDRKDDEDRKIASMVEKVSDLCAKNVTVQDLLKDGMLRITMQNLDITTVAMRNGFNPVTLKPYSQQRQLANAAPVERQTTHVPPPMDIHEIKREVSIPEAQAEARREKYGNRGNMKLPPLPLPKRDANLGSYVEAALKKVSQSKVQSPSTSTSSNSSSVTSPSHCGNNSMQFVGKIKKRK